MAKTTPPRKAKQVKNSVLLANNAGFEVSASNCPVETVVEAVADYNNHGWNQSTNQTYGDGKAGFNGKAASFTSLQDQSIGESLAVNASGAPVNLKDQGGIISFTLANSLPASAKNYFFATASTPGANSAGVTGSGVVSFIYDKSGPQAGYIPAVVHGGTSGTEYTFLLPSTVTGSGGANMPASANRGFVVTIAGAVAPGESIQVYTASGGGTAAQTLVATGSAFTYSGSLCSTPNYQVTQVTIPTGALASTSKDAAGGHPLKPGIAGKEGQSGIIIKYTASFASGTTGSNLNDQNTPYAGVTVTIAPTAIVPADWV
jgi:hypothetical protein